MWGVEFKWGLNPIRIKPYHIRANRLQVFSKTRIWVSPQYSIENTMARFLFDPAELNSDGVGLGRLL